MFFLFCPAPRSKLVLRSNSVLRCCKGLSAHVKLHVNVVYDRHTDPWEQPCPCGVSMPFDVSSLTWMHVNGGLEPCALGVSRPPQKICPAMMQRPLLRLPFLERHRCHHHFVTKLQAILPKSFSPQPFGHVRIQRHAHPWHALPAYAQQVFTSVAYGCVALGLYRPFAPAACRVPTRSA